MNRTCGNFTGGWLRIANLNMREDGVQCPVGLTETVNMGQRLCMNSVIDFGCSQVFFSANTTYSQICGMVIGFQLSTSDAFGPEPNSETINDPYVDGVSLTYGNPRNHIWTFASALNEPGVQSPGSNCPCTNTNLASSATLPPSFVGTNYFCDTGTDEDPVPNTLFNADPLWDGAGCGPNNACCSFNNPPWFFREFASPVMDNIEMRLCRDQNSIDENVLIEQIELYIR